MRRCLLCDGRDLPRAFHAGKVGYRVGSFDDTNFSQRQSLAILGYDNATAKALAKQRFQRLCHWHRSFAGTDDKNATEVGERINSIGNFDGCTIHAHISSDGMGRVNSFNRSIEDRYRIRAKSRQRPFHRLRTGDRYRPGNSSRQAKGGSRNYGEKSSNCPLPRKRR